MTRLPRIFTDRMGVQQQARKLANRFHAEYLPTAAALQRLLVGLPSLLVQPNERSKPHAANYALSILSAAYQALPWKEACVFFEMTSLAVLEERLWISHYLSGRNSDYGIPLFSRNEFADALNDFQKFLAADREHLLRTGLPTKEFRRSRWMEAQLAKLYPVQRTEKLSPFEVPIRYLDNDAWYYWVKVVQNPDGFGASEFRVPRDEADILEGFIAADALRLEQLREKVFDLKLAVLGEGARALLSPDKTDVWSACLPHFVAALSTDEVEFLSRMDDAYQNPPAGRSLSHALAAMLGKRTPVDPGGFRNLIELIGHVQQECTIGTMHKTRKALGEFVATSDDGPVLCSSNPWPYFSFIDQGHDREVIENAFGIFHECESKEMGFWPEFHDRVTSAIGEEFNQEIVLEIRTKPSVAERLRRNIAVYAEFVVNHLENTGKFPAFQMELQARTTDALGNNAPSRNDETPDGPCHPYTWRLEGKIIADHMRTGAWNMVNHLWQLPNHSATFDDLKDPVYKDQDHIAVAGEFGSLRKSANAYFGRHKIPYCIGIKKAVVYLTPTE